MSFKIILSNYGSPDAPNLFFKRWSWAPPPRVIPVIPEPIVLELNKNANSPIQIITHTIVIFFLGRLLFWSARFKVIFIINSTIEVLELLQSKFSWFQSALVLFWNGMGKLCLAQITFGVSYSAHFTFTFTSPFIHQLPN